VIGLGVLLLGSMLATVFVAQWRTGEAGTSQQFAAGANFLAGFMLISLIFAAIHKLLSDTHLEWGDVAVGAIGTATFYDLGQFLIGVYLHSAGASAAYSAAGGLIVVLLWIYYSAQVFLLGAEFTKIYAARRGQGKYAAENSCLLRVATWRYDMTYEIKLHVGSGARTRFTTRRMT
jgi:membrane protein